MDSSPEEERKSLRIKTDMLKTPLMPIYEEPSTPRKLIKKGSEVVNNPSNPRCFSYKNIEFYLVAVNSIVSLIWGYKCIVELDVSWKDLQNDLDIFLVLSASVVFWSLLAAFILTVCLIILSCIFSRASWKTIIGCLPILYIVFLYVGYAIIIPLGLMLIGQESLTLSSQVYWFIVYQIITGILMTLLACYSCLCQTSNKISPHLLELEEETFKINDQSLIKYREEVKEALSNSQKLKKKQKLYEERGRSHSSPAFRRVLNSESSGSPDTIIQMQQDYKPESTDTTNHKTNSAGTQESSILREQEAGVRTERIPTLSLSAPKHRSRTSLGNSKPGLKLYKPWKQDDSNQQ